MGICCLRDDFVESSIKIEVIGVTMSVFLLHILFVFENLFMILMFYFTYHLDTWYSLPVTACVCVFSVLGSSLRICLLRWLSRKPNGCSPAANNFDESTCEVEDIFPLI